MRDCLSSVQHLEWAHQFKCPVYLCANDKEWLNREDKAGVRKWITGTQSIDEVSGVTAIVAGGHFDGSMILHWEGKIFIADTMMSVPVSHHLISLRVPSQVTVLIRICVCDVYSPASTSIIANRAPRPSPSCGRTLT